jgi:cobalt-zinc-cadmium efflux system outer membrane protein
VPKDAGFSDVQQLAVDRTGYIVQWNRNTADDRAVAFKVHELLSHELSASDAAQIALLNNRHLQATFEDLGIAQADLVQAGLLKNPVFDLGVRFPNRGPSGTYLDIAAAEDFLDIALIPARQKLAQGQFDQAKARVSDEVLSLAAQARSAFFTYQAAVQTVELRKAIAQAAAASFEAARKLHDAGNMNDLEIASQRAQDARARVDLADAQAAAAESRESLNDVMGVWGPDTQWKGAGHLPDVPAREISVEGLESLALRQRQDVAAAHQDVLVQARTLGLTADFRFFQEVDLGPEFEHETDGQWRIGPTLSLPIPLFDQGQAKIARAQAVLRQSEERYYAVTVDVRSEVRAASARLLNARTKALLYRDQVLPIEQDLLRQTQLQYNGMFLGVFQLLQAKRDQIDAAREYIEALRDYWTARADVERAVGGRLIPAIPATLPTSRADSKQQNDSYGEVP